MITLITSKVEDAMKHCPPYSQSTKSPSPPPAPGPLVEPNSQGDERPKGTSSSCCQHRGSQELGAILSNNRGCQASCDIAGTLLPGPTAY